MIIRIEEQADYLQIYAVNASAFETPAEANLVDVLRREAHPVISLVADEGEKIVGHIMFSPVLLSGHPDLKIIGLGPMAVVPEFQQKGIGSALIKTGIEKCKALGYGGVIVLGHSGYYPRFGFVPAVQYGISCEFDVPEEVFMVLELQQGYLEGAHGIIRYHSAFKNV